MANVVDVGGGPAGEHRPTAGESQPLPLHSDPVLVRHLHHQLTVRNVGKPRELPARRPQERCPVPRRRRNHATQQLLPSWAVPFPVHQPFPLEPQRPVLVLACCVLAAFDIARIEHESARCSRRHFSMDEVSISVELSAL